MRLNGSIQEATDLDRGHHVCWPYDDSAHFHDVAISYVADGFMRDERVLCIAQEPLRGSLLSLDPAHVELQGAASPALVVLTAAEAYSLNRPRTIDEQLAFYDEATRRALTDGYTGLRVLADVSEVMAEPDRRAGQIEWERTIDEYIGQAAGLSALCAYRSDHLDAATLSAVTCVHPLVREAAPHSRFRLFVDTGRLILAGSVDASTATQLARMLSGTHRRQAGTVLDVSMLEFIDAEGIAAIAQWSASLAAERPTPVQVVGASPTLGARLQNAGLSVLPPLP